VSGAGVVSLQLEVNRDEALRYLGTAGGESRSSRGARRVDELWAEALALVEPRGAWRIIDRATAAATGMPEPDAQVAVAVCTIGPALEEAGAELAGRGRLLDAMVLDAIGSAAAEAAADALNLLVCEAAAARGREAAPRLSPGYGDWDTISQARLLALLPIAALGLRLTSGSMMVPRKSVSFAANLARRGTIQAHPAERCARCGLPNCRHRIAPTECG
jgi:hypothetical protein